ncbi:MAG: MCE family protein [Verrucomicrobiaceae bacterium]|nr:MCE family protein [Verrucomicrobiaceae bacterium]
MEERDKKTELLVGLFLTVGLVMMSLLILQFGSVRDLFKGSFFLSVSFPDASGIKEASPVVLAGKRIGKVKNKPRHNENFNAVIIDLEIFQGEKIPAESIFTITTAGLMGDAFVDIEPPKHISDKFITETQTVTIVGKEAGGLSNLQSAAEKIGKQVSSFIEDDLKPAVSKDLRPALAEIKAATTKLNQGALSDETISKIKNTVAKLDSAVSRVDEKVFGDQNVSHLKESLADLKEAAASFKAASKNIEDSSKKLGPLLDKLDAPIAKLDKVMASADDTMKSIKGAADSFSVAARNITNGKGLLGALINDPKLKTDFHDLIYNMKTSGPVWYKNNADKERSKQQTQPAPAPQPEQPKKRGFFQGN